MAIIEKNDLKEFTVEEVEALLETCEAELKEREQKRIQDVERQINELAKSVQMSPEELVMHMHRSKSGQNKRIVFQNPDNPQETWAGRGKKPKWIVREEANGRDIEDFRVSDEKK